jgi:hypothetical protein
VAVQAALTPHFNQQTAKPAKIALIRLIRYSPPNRFEPFFSSLLSRPQALTNAL